MKEITVDFNPQPREKMKYWLEESNGEVIVRCMRILPGGQEDMIQNLIRFHPDGRARIARNHYFKFTLGAGDELVAHRFSDE